MLSRICIALGACCLIVAGVAASGKGFGGRHPGARLAEPAGEEATAGGSAVAPAAGSPAVAVGAGGLAAAVRKAGPAGPEWIGYQVPMVAGRGFTCCWDHGWRQGAPCHLEKSNQGWGSRGDHKVEQQDLIVLLRVDRGRVGRVRGLSAGCPIDPDGKRLTQLSGVTEEESLALLGGLAEGKGGGKSDDDEALAAISFHASKAADTTLRGLARNAVEETRSQALFWIAQRGAPGAAETILAAIDSDPSSEVREEAVFALSQLPDDGTRSLLALLQRAKSAEIRRQALFWLAQSDDPRAFDALAEILER